MRRCITRILMIKLLPRWVQIWQMTKLQSMVVKQKICIIMFTLEILSQGLDVLLYLQYHKLKKFGSQTAEHGIDVDIGQNIAACAHSLRPRKSNQGVRFYSTTRPPPIRPIISDPVAGPSTEPTINTQTAEYVPDAHIISDHDFSILQSMTQRWKLLLLHFLQISVMSHMYFFHKERKWQQELGKLIEKMY